MIRRWLAKALRGIAWLPEGVSIGGQWAAVQLFDLADWVEGN